MNIFKKIWPFEKGGVAEANKPVTIDYEIKLEATGATESLKEVIRMASVLKEELFAVNESAKLAESNVRSATRALEEAREANKAPRISKNRKRNKKS